MGSGAYLATKSEREVHEAELAKERREIAERPEEEQEELSLFYQLKGFSVEEAGAMAACLAENPEEMLKILAHEELGLSAQTFPVAQRLGDDAHRSGRGGDHLRHRAPGITLPALKPAKWTIAVFSNIIFHINRLSGG
jgi:VIT1/CCC1 family predicted Fe2+/Mn2+ transporter